MDLWHDGRSGPAGDFAGNIALRELEQSHGVIRKLKGTIFESPKSILIGRVCATDQYLDDAILHWANASWDQHSGLLRDAQAENKELVYLFITATNQPATIRYWCVPCKVIEALFVERGKNIRGAICAVHILSDRKRQIIGKIDVQKYAMSVILDSSQISRLDSAFESRHRTAKNPQKKSLKRAPAAQSTNSLLQASVTTAVPAVDEQTDYVIYDIPASKAHTIQMRLSLPLSSADLGRLKGWIDLMADVLTEPIYHKLTGERKWLHQAIQEGVAQLDRGDTVDGSQAFDRILERRSQGSR